MGTFKQYENWKNNWKDLIQKEAIKIALRTIKENAAKWASEIICTAAAEETNIMYYFYMDKDGNIDKDYVSENNIATPLDPAEWDKYDIDGEDMICFCLIYIIFDNSEQDVIDVSLAKTLDSVLLNKYINIG